MKKFLLTSFAILACLTLICGCGKNDEGKKDDKKDNGPKVGLGPFELKVGTLGDQPITNSIKLTKTSFVSEDAKTSYTTDITNTTDKQVEIYELHIIIKNENGQEMVRFKANLNNLEAGETKTITTGMDFKLEGFKTIQYEIVESQPTE